MKILYRADGGHPVGMGHIQRLLRVSACWVKSSPEVEVLLVTRENPASRRLISGAGLPNLQVHYLPEGELGILPELRVLDFIGIIEQYSPHTIVVDMLDNAEAEMSQLRQMAPTLVTLDDRGPGRVYADLICNFLVRDPNSSALSNRTWLREGPGYATLGPEYVGVKREREEPERVGRVLVSVGGADAVGLAVNIAQDLLQVEELREVDFTLGPAFQKRAELDAIIKQAPWQANIHTSIPTLLPLFMSADLAIVAGGLTMHEAACSGTPSIAVCQPIDHQVIVGNILQEAGCMLNLGYGTELQPGQIAEAVRQLSSNPEQRREMVAAGPRACDGLGSQRVVEAIVARASASVSRQSC